MSPFKRITLASLAMLASMTFIAACGSSAGSDTDKKSTESSSDSTTTSPVKSDSVVTIDGTDYTCAEIINAKVCDEETQEVFNLYKDNIDTYVNSGKLGPLNTSEYKDAAYAGLAACVLIDEGQEVYIETLQEDPVYENMDGTMLLPAWFEAQQSLCRLDGSRTSDMTTP